MLDHFSINKCKLSAFNGVGLHKFINERHHVNGLQFCFPAKGLHQQEDVMLYPPPRRGGLYKVAALFLRGPITLFTGAG